MQARGFKGDFLKFYDTAQHDSFKTAVQAGVLFTENTLNPHFLFHGKSIHNLQRIVAVLAYESGLLSINYAENGQNKVITLSEIFHALFDDNFLQSMNNLVAWTDVYDCIQDDQSSMNDPYQFHSMLMTNCQTTLPTLSALVRHSFYKAVYRLTENFNDNTGLSWTTEQVWDNYMTQRLPHIVSPTEPKTYTWLKKTSRLPDNTTVSENNPVGPHPRLGKI